nr:hypothetical protein [Tanacetum cinerariifolium]
MLPVDEMDLDNYWVEPMGRSCTKSSKKMSSCTIREVHPVLPNQGDTMHERPAGKIGVYTRFLDFANFRLHLSTFLVDILRYFRINISQLSVIGAVKEFLCLVGLSRHYTLDEETYPLFLDKDGEDMDIFAFIHTSDPTKVKVVERERKEDEPLLLKTTVGHTVPLLPVAHDRGESELDVNVDKLFDKGGSGTQAGQGDSAGGGGDQGINIQPVTETTDAVTEDVIPLGEPIPTMPFVTSFVSATPEREGEGNTDFITGRNLRTISAPQRFVISSYSPDHSGANIAKLEVDSFSRLSAPVITAATTITSTADPHVVVKEKIVEPSLFAAESTSVGRTDPAMAGLTDLTGSDFFVDGIHTMVDEFAPPKFFVSVCGMEHDQLFIEFNVGAAHQMSLSAEVKMRAEYNIRDKRRLKSVVEEKNQLLKSRDEEIENLKAQLLLKEAEASEAIHLRTEASKLETAEKSLRDEVNALNERNNILEKERNALDVKVTDLEAIVDGLAAEINQGREGRALTDVVAYNPSVEADYVSALQQLQSVNFSLLAELKTNKDTSIEAVMNILRLEEHLAERLGLNESQPHADKLMVPIHHSLNKTVIGASSLLLTLDVSDARVWRIRENIMSHRSLFQDVFIPLAEPLSAAALTGMEGTSDAVLATVDITTALSVTLASANTVTPLSVDDYGVMGMNDQSAVNENVVDEDANPFPNVDDAELNIPQ